MGPLARYGGRAQLEDNANSDPSFVVDIIDTLTADNDRLRAAITTAVEELRAEHAPARSGPPPFGCVICWPKDGSWPCVSRMVADDLAAAVGGEHG